MEPVLIDLQEYEYSGEGANGASYNHRTDKSVMLKLYNESAPYQIVTAELEAAHKVWAAGIATPEPGELVTDGAGRFGIRFRRITNKKSFARAVGDDPAHVEEYARRFARMCLRLHSTHLPKGEFRDIKEADLEMLRNNPFFTEAEKAKVAEFIMSVPDADTAIHGDLSFGNAIFGDGGEYFIDLGDFACGSPLFDLGMVLLTCHYDGEDFLREAFHMGPDTADRFWHYFVKEYWGKDADPDEMDRKLKPFAGLMTLIIERNSGVHFPDFHKLLAEIL